MSQFRMHPEDLKTISDSVTENLKVTLQELHNRDSAVASNTTFSVDEVAKMVNKHKSTILRHIKKGILKASKPGETYIITQKSLNNYIDGTK